jgi:hypothetical protein
MAEEQLYMLQMAVENPQMLQVAVEQQYIVQQEVLATGWGGRNPCIDGAL